MPMRSILRIAKQLNTLYLGCGINNTHHKEDRYGKGIRQGKKQNKEVRNLSWWGWTQRIAAILSVPPDRCIGSVYGRTAASDHLRWWK